MNAWLRRCVVIAGVGVGVVLPASASATTISFDTDASGAALKAPATFARTHPLQDAYAPLGVRFRGRSRDVGGAILDQRSGFGIPARSGPNFLAFNRAGYARDPEAIAFDALQRRVTIFAGDGGRRGHTFTMKAFAAGARVDRTVVRVPRRSYGRLTVASPAGIHRVEILAGEHENTFVLDDLRFAPAAQAGDAAGADPLSASNSGRRAGGYFLAHAPQRPHQPAGPPVRAPPPSPEGADHRRPIVFGIAVAERASRGGAEHDSARARRVGITRRDHIAGTISSRAEHGGIGAGVGGGEPPNGPPIAPPGLRRNQGRRGSGPPPGVRFSAGRPTAQVFGRRPGRSGPRGRALGHRRKVAE
jgi:hypothetical protein